MVERYGIGGCILRLFTDVMTVYNYIKNQDETETWQRNIIKGVQWSHSKTETTVSNGVITQNKVESITIDFKKDYGNAEYVDPVTFASLEDKTGYWTLNAKSKQDIIVLGETENEISKSYKIGTLQDDFQYSGTVKSVSDNRNRRMLKNMKVVVQ